MGFSAAASWTCPSHPGRPADPRVGATKDAKRLAMKDAKTVTKIPVLPISYGDALPFLKTLGGKVAARGVAGRSADHLSHRPRTGESPPEARVRMGDQPVYNVIAKIDGSRFPDEWIVHGNHHDAWVNGADDPTRGSSP